jgi:hypothetical protein
MQNQIEPKELSYPNRNLISNLDSKKARSLDIRPTDPSTVDILLCTA